MDSLFGVVPHDHEALQQGRLGAAVNLQKVEDDAHSVENKDRSRAHVETV